MTRLITCKSWRQFEVLGTLVVELEVVLPLLPLLLAGAMVLR